MISTGNTVELRGTITATTAADFTVELEEAYIDQQWRRFQPLKTMTIATSDYDTALTDQELELCKLLASSKGASQVLTQDQLTIAASIVAKLTTP